MDFFGFLFLLFTNGFKIQAKVSKTEKALKNSNVSQGRNIIVKNNQQNFPKPKN